MSSFLRVEPAYLDFVPCYPHLPQTLIASCLNSQIHKECIEDLSNFPAELVLKLGKLFETTINIDN